ncbi:hypothetical protein ALC57_10031 [Trachymyrmex cornetzi]|uniref:Uncharacterized protein n=1 Tax=Trachymyrmex cornetzi TaxID=471704 RepID=A0A195DY78_9HYME|nr:hypothetical protein ALC57_10031 [Trachymyrmex cornetzi]
MTIYIYQFLNIALLYVHFFITIFIDSSFARYFTSLYTNCEIIMF